MPSHMAGMAERHAVVGVVPEFGMLCPRPQVVDVQAILRAALTRRCGRLHSAVAADVSVAGKYGGMERYVERVRLISCSRWTRAALPVRVRGSDQVLVRGRPNARPLQSLADLSLRLLRVRPSAQRLRDVLALTLRQGAAGRRLTSSRRADLRSCLRAFRRVAHVLIDPCRAAGARAEAPVALVVLGPTAFANLSHFKANLTCC